MYKNFKPKNTYQVNKIFDKNIVHLYENIQNTLTEHTAREIESPSTFYKYNSKDFKISPLIIHDDFTINSHL